MSGNKSKSSGMHKRLFSKKHMIEDLARVITPILDFVFPKDNYTIVFGSNSTHSITGSPKAMFERICLEHPRYNAYFITQRPKRAGEIKANTLSSLRIFLKARYIVSSHGLSDFGIFRFSQRKKMIATWHGIALKGCGYLQKNFTKDARENLEEYVKKASACIASSEYDAKILTNMFGYTKEQMKITGRPRNDSLLSMKKQKITILKELLPQLKGDETIILYGPTFRDKEMIVRGKDLRLFPFDDITDAKLDEFLEKNNIVILIRAHINDTSTTLTFDSKRIIEFNTNVCEDVNEILPEVDILITDYSSMAYDFLLLDRPIFFFPYDIEDYIKYRGLVVDDYDYMTPGPKISSFTQFVSETQKYLQGKEDGYEEVRREISKIVHGSQTKDSTSIILNLLPNL